MLFKNILYIDENFDVKSGYIATVGDRIAEISPSPIDGCFGETIDGAGKLLLPGIVNAHCHAPMTLLRGYGEGKPLHDWLEQLIYPFEDKMTEEDAYWGALLAIAEMLRSGVTSFTDMYRFCGSVCEAVKTAGIKVNASHGLKCFDGGRLRDGAGFSVTERLIDKWNGAEDGRVIAEAAIHVEFTSHESFVRETAEYAKHRGVGVQTHLSETERDLNECVSRHGVTPAAYFARTGFFDNRAVASHCVYATDGDMDILREKRVTAAHCPTSNLKLGSGAAPIARLMNMGVNVALGTDGASSNNNLNMFEEMHLAGLVHKWREHNAATVTPRDVLKMATRNGAISQGRLDCGLIKRGFKADLAVLDIDRPHMYPVHDLLANIVFSAQAGDVIMTVSDGRVLYRDGGVLTFDERETARKVSEAAKRIASEL